MATRLGCPRVLELSQAENGQAERGQVERRTAKPAPVPTCATRKALLQAAREDVLEALDSYGAVLLRGWDVRLNSSNGSSRSSSRLGGSQR